MATPGPKKGQGGRPRKKNPQGRVGDGYKRVSVGPKSKGKRVYQHVVKARGAKAAVKGVGKASKTVVDHKNKKTGDNRKKNLRIMGRGKNANR